MALKTDAVSSVLAGAGASATGAAIAILLIAGASEDAIFALVGALIGAAATVAGAAWLADRTTRTERANEFALLIQEYKPLLKLANAALDGGTEENLPWSHRTSLSQLAVGAADAHQITNEALAHAKMLSFRQRVHLKRLSNLTEQLVMFWNDINSQDWKDSPLDERTWPNAIGDLKVEVRETLRQLDVIS